MFELYRHDYTIALSENEAYNTFVTTDLALNLGATTYSNCAVIANTAAAMNCPQPWGRPFLGMRPIPAVWTNPAGLADGRPRISTEYPLMFST